MIVVDSSVWIDFFNDRSTLEVERLTFYIKEDDVLLGDLILCEVLKGFRTDDEARIARVALAAFEFASLGGLGTALKGADNYRFLRSRGVTVRKTIDLLIGTFCIENGYPLLHNDRDFQPMVEHLGLITA